MPNNPNDWYRKTFPTAHRLLLERELNERLPRLSGSVLVLGAGHDPYRDWLTSASNICITDVSDERGIVLDQIADAHDLPFEDGSFDSIVATEVFEHLHSPGIAATEVCRALKNGGRALITVPFMFHVHGDPFDFQRLTRQGLMELFQDFSRCEITEFGGRRHVISDIVTTSVRLLAAFRIFNHLLAVPGLTGRASLDCPSGYIVELTK